MTKGIKFDGEKPDYSLIPPFAEEELAKLLTFGGKKYAPNNWQKVKPKKRYYAAAGRHLGKYLMAVLRGKKEDQYDDESGVHHLICAACNCMFLYEHETVYSVDEPFYGVTEEAEKQQSVKIELDDKALEKALENIKDHMEKQKNTRHPQPYIPPYEPYNPYEPYKPFTLPLTPDDDWWKRGAFYPCCPPIGSADFQYLQEKLQTTIESTNPKL